MPLASLLDALGSSGEGLSAAEAATRLAEVGPNAVRSHRARPLAVLARQLRSPLLVLLVVTAGVSFFVGQRSDAEIIGVIVALSVGLGFLNEYRAERAVETLHEQLRQAAVVRRDGEWVRRDLVEVVPGDVVALQAGSLVPADLRLLSAVGLECDEAVLSGESLPVAKVVDEAGAGTAPLQGCALMGTVVRAGRGEGVVVATAGDTEFGRIALRLGEQQAETEFQAGLRRFSGLLAGVAGVLTASIFGINLILQRPLIDALLFSLAIAVGITPQLLPAVVSTSLAAGSRRLARRRVLVKRLVCIEDLGNTELLLTDKTGTLTEGRITLERTLGPDGRSDSRVLLLGLLCNEATVAAGEAVAGNPLDVALWQAPGAGDADVGSWRRLDLVPFDSEHRRTIVLVEGPEHRLLVVKGAPESVLPACEDVPAAARAVLDGELAAGSRIVAVATRTSTPDADTVAAARAEGPLRLAGFLVFLDPPKPSAAIALRRLEQLGMTVKVVTGDHPVVAAKVCRELGLDVAGSLTGAELDTLDDAELLARLPRTTIFSRVSPDQKRRVIEAHQRAGHDVAYLGDGVNDAVALHKADVGISVDSATDVARDAADIVLLEKDLGVLADGVVEGRRVFTNTVKYVLMGTSSNFGNMFSAAAASAFLPFLPMLPSQLLLNNLLYDAGQMTIPTDRVDDEQLSRPSHWDMGFIRRFMLFFGPISSLFDFVTFAVLLHVFRAGPGLFRSGWFVESLATQSLVIFVVRTRRSPFFRSRPSGPLLAATLAVVAVAAVLPQSPLAGDLGFVHLPAWYFAALGAMVAGYLALAEIAKRSFYEHLQQPVAEAGDTRRRRVQRRASPFSHGGVPRG